jgi:hypothetical protein
MDQSPSTNDQTSTNHQAPNSKHHTAVWNFGHWSLEFVWNLEFGHWSLMLAWCLMISV